ncbi:RNA polymerase sigma factor [Saccharophagus sp. K07]|jgi:RNA polymerase sigma factor (sigma-70 family)|uniref:RNA polymerase sigma factor n=1 Tax=Saccharophagus sp. K07 TaxID=2283636 RepID=UPI001651C34F|nr:RNA polymerase sigma factor [Saccharophagus sp. K07]MBC6906441.1 RNA polymerase sigma factor [Saccharophagus sp. K07]
MSLSDKDLIARVVDHGDRHAYGQLALRYQSQLRQWCRRLCNGDHHTADDLAQEVFIKAYGALASFQGDAKFSVWLYRIAFNAAASKWRKKRIEWCDLDSAAEIPAAECEATNIARTGDIEQALKQLSEAQQIAVRLCFEDGLSHEEAAGVMGIPLGTLKTHVARGKARLKQLLADWS